MTQTTENSVPRPLPEDWERALAVVAHPDDLEFGSSSAIARWTGQGKDVVELLVTKGEAGIDGMAPEECAPLRMAEQRASAAAVGAATVEFLDFPDGTLEYGLPLRAALAAAIRRHRPEVVVSINFRDHFPGANGFNHADHRVLGPALLDAVRDAANRWVFREQLDEGLRPWSGVRFVAFGASPRATHYVELGEDDLAAGVASLDAHEVYLSNLSGFDQKAFLPRAAARSGEWAGVPLATAFEVFET
ncbi:MULTISPECIES: PIG-L deacetylase family protein [Nocardiopsis]|uniref:GlcNAc-PI de-N-acetylase n=1 Tax=Nocardiopsis sinuspersici TaxID=501010 RepID=A0A1V3C1G4_9ACTN|nr:MULTISPECIES: PIG-L deacetylase family protein [Nocardiopsis]NYH50605.1 LmbE family N-acetylglucosaminyl deacetylase [Nocardiopsis sinuspersici]OOC54472.1 GlcNAc-PI de-N-acetylase [Nocardiopsis sinuspersici]